MSSSIKQQGKPPILATNRSPPARQESEPGIALHDTHARAPSCTAWLWHACSIRPRCPCMADRQASQPSLEALFPPTCVSLKLGRRPRQVTALVGSTALPRQGQWLPSSARREA
eukprot:scaffold7328_cov314-Pinguiococcus_pyrenoidosus.AAC.96